MRGRLLEALSVIRDSPEASDYERAFSLIRVYLARAEKDARDPELDAAFANAGRAVFMRRLREQDTAIGAAQAQPDFDAQRAMSRGR